ncbi:hypothetical protein AB0I66_21750 [Streptomyces sp. NPDC050439]|uniref:hypothetical protein n=1 Tax=unclassified Streptomyces TaxID=2593676 RepID=UPI003417D709
MDAQHRQRAAEWLARAQQQPAHAWREWSEVGVAILPLGRRFVAPRLSEELVHSAVGSRTPGEVAAGLEQLLDGPVIFDGRSMGGTYYPVMRPHRRDVWEHQDVAPLLAEGTFLGVPRLDRREPPGTFWAVPPRAVGDLCEPDAVDALITLACIAARGTEQ